MKYFAVEVRGAGEAADALIGRLADLGSEGFFEEGDSVTAYFSEGTDPAEIRREVDIFRDVLMSSGLRADFRVHVQPLPEQDWNETWKKSFSPINVGERLTIIPSWIRHDTDRITVVIDPATVFGTGHHVTTRACLVLIEKYAGICEAAGRFLDIGTGTGILAIAASKLGFREVTAVDTDPPAVENARENAASNGVDHIHIFKGDITAVQGRYDLIAANLLSETLIRSAQEIARRLNPGGFAILSGMLAGQEGEVLRAMEAAGLSRCEKLQEDTWVTAVVKKCISSEK